MGERGGELGLELELGVEFANTFFSSLAVRIAFITVPFKLSSSTAAGID